MRLGAEGRGVSEGFGATMSWRARVAGQKPPEGWELIEEVIGDFENQLREAVNEDHNGLRKNETTWKIHRLHWEKNRFIFDLMYKRKVMKRELFDWLVRNKIADGPLIAKWRRPGYENLCSLLAIQKGATNFGGTSICRVPLKHRAAAQRISPNVVTGCISCAPGDSAYGGPIWWNTQLEEEGDEEGEGRINRAVWVQEGSREATAGHKRPREEPQAGGAPADDDEDELPEDVKRRLAALRGEA